MFVYVFDIRFNYETVHNIGLVVGETGIERHSVSLYTILYKLHSKNLKVYKEWKRHIFPFFNRAEAIYYFHFCDSCLLIRWRIVAARVIDHFCLSLSVANKRNLLRSPSQRVYLLKCAGGAIANLSRVYARRIKVIFRVCQSDRAQQVFPAFPEWLLHLLRDNLYIVAEN